MTSPKLRIPGLSVGLLSKSLSSSVPVPGSFLTYDHSSSSKSLLEQLEMDMLCVPATRAMQSCNYVLLAAFESLEFILLKVVTSDPSEFSP